MKPLLPAILLLMVCAGCGDSRSIDVMNAGVSVMVKGSPDTPFVSAGEGELVDHVLVVRARHVDSGHTFDSEVQIRADKTKEWVAFPALEVSAEEKHVYFPDSVGVELSLSYSIRTDGTLRVNDEVGILIPFGEDLSGREGAFEYEAVWKES